MRVHVQGGLIKLVLPIPEPEQNITWLKNDFKLRALRRGKDITVTELSWNGSLLDDDDKICDVVDNFAQLVAAGPGIEPVAPKQSSIDHNGDTRTKRKYTRGGHKKLKLVAPILESYLSEMSTTSEKERQKFYAKIVSLPQMVAAEVNRDEVVSWYKRARKKTRTGDETSTENRNNGVGGGVGLNDGLMSGIMALDGNVLLQSQGSMLSDPSTNSMMNGLDHSHLVSHSIHQGGLNSDLSHMMGLSSNQRVGMNGLGTGVSSLDPGHLGSLDLSNRQNLVGPREMAPEELAYAEPSSQAAYAAAMATSTQLPPPPIVAPVAATQPVVGL
mmetsp:Transcript_32887/g.38601  ORF Transcript_32887/g.38601 Transcript_32887/m.38601 type:complete len:329 (-) Transcript_32887:60-1046(-)|eukprot:CAMPEP_0114359194 /NCGR_PEP_ID=MMETSP0101-20121206/22829_1 /TAXON_ID=38822 ORGANISM="Pteridomonas danica, Strain PT" /NCGR_SAMPLE_ID=MMETSP0101 /ASSEMBLY_ACC=CAM_ASM_000211 /LENGTH=328 /DNA_ID=CAMNT_0001502605 /DNA_START=166 /DNA_END=1152 /DNA_ORIENTATION=-